MAEPGPPRRGDDRRARLHARRGLRAGPARPPLGTGPPPTVAARRLRPGLPVAGRTGRGRAGSDRCRPRAAHATPPAVRPGVGGLGGRGEGSVSHRTARAWWLASLRRGLHLLAP